MFTQLSSEDHISPDYSKFSLISEKNQEKQFRLKSCLKPKIQDCSMSSNKQVKFLLQDSKGDQRIVNPNDLESDSELNYDSDDSLSYYAI